MALTIGILVCDHVAPEKLGEHGDYDSMFESLIQRDDKSIQFTIYDLIADQFPIDLSACDAYIITGSQFGVYEDIPWIHKAKQLVQQLYKAEIPTIGICFGHQLIAEALGGKVIKAEDKGLGLGVQTWEITHKENWMGHSNDATLSLNACHQDQVIELPENSEKLLSSNFCPIAGFQTHSMLGIQGHPEFDYAYTKYLVDYYEDTLNDQEKAKIEQSFKNKPQSQLVSRWMVNFIKDSLYLT